MNPPTNSEKLITQNVPQNEISSAELRADNSVWKVGSRWSYDGNANSCILDIFRKYHVVFVGHEHERFNQIREGDLITISSGMRVVALGRAMENPKPFAAVGVSFLKTDSTGVHPDDIGLACRINFQDLREQDILGCGRGAFTRLNDNADQCRKLYNDYQESKRNDEFSIKARSCTLLRNSSSPEDVLLKSQLIYRIPIFQRAYSWERKEVRRLLMDLLNAYEGRLGRAKREPMFIGTMQISALKTLDNERSISCHDIIDGQQRLTTLALILRALQLLGDQKHQVGDFDWITTAIGEQQGYLDAALCDPFPLDKTDYQNKYLENLKLIINQLQDDESLDTTEDFAAFYDYLTSRVFAVVIETRAGLSKTLQIFDSINTSGMDLNGGDVFKIRYYEYLREHEGCEEAIFKQIADLYTKIDRLNKKAGEDAIWMEGILDCLKWIICERLKLPYAVRELTGATFFDRLFDTILKVEAWEGFLYEKCTQLKLPVSLIEEVIDATSKWHHALPTLRPESMAMDNFIWWSRYGNYHHPLIINFLWRFRPSHEELEDFLIIVGKLLIVHSIRSQKKTYHGRNAMHSALGKICCDDINMNLLLSEIGTICSNEASSITERLTNDWLAGIPRAKNLVCRLVEFLEQLEVNNLSNDDLCKLLFSEQEIDIEHIEAANHKDGTLRQEIQDSWDQDLHGLGNLTILERDINRSISNDPYSSHKRERYLKSKFISVKAFAAANQAWTLEDAQKRKNILVSRLTEYLCGVPIENVLS